MRAVDLNRSHRRWQGDGCDCLPVKPQLSLFVQRLICYIKC